MFKANCHPQGALPMFLKRTAIKEFYSDHAYQKCRFYKYIIYVNLLVLRDFVNQCTKHGTNNIEKEC